MTRKILITILIIFTISYISANKIYENYRRDISEEKSIYYLENNDDKISNSISISIKKGHNIIGITSNLKIAEKIKKIYESNNISIEILKEKSNNDEFYNELEQYDVLLKNTENISELNNILSTILSSYEEILQLQEQF